MKLQFSLSGSAFFKAVFAWVLLGLMAAPSLQAQNTPLNDSNFNTARDLWFSDQASATATYGHIRDWNVTGVTNMSQAFKDKTTFDENITGWDVSNVTNMADMFRGATSFNQPIGDWNVSSVTSMTSMFLGASTFNQPIANWDTSKVTRMEYMFSQAGTFNQPIGNWDTSKVTRMDYMFNAASVFNQPIANWNVSSVTNMGSMFNGAFSFNKPISDWNTSSVTDLNRMFGNAPSFNQDVSDWNVSGVTDMSDLFFNANALSNAHKGLIHSSFSSNSNWNTDWSAHVPAPASLTNANFQTAVDLWCSDKTAAFATYGHIKDWNVTGVTSMNEAFKDKTTFDENITGWDVSNVTTMSRMFQGASAFNQDIGDWNTSAVTSTWVMFWGANSFNQNIGDWNTSSVLAMNGMFNNAHSFNQPIGNWDVSSVNTTHQMFNKATSFDQPLENWNVSAVTSMGEMFKGATSINQRIGDWNVSSVTNMQGLFRNALAFNQPIGNWDTSKVTDMANMFRDASNFNQPIGDWNVSAVTKMNGMFLGASAFNQPIGNWDVSLVTNMASMFLQASAFDQPIGDWNTSAVTSFNSTFEQASSFNQDLGSWDTSTVTDMRDVFNSASSFNQDLSDWNVSAVTNMIMPLANTPALSEVNKGLIHGTFSNNPNWTTDWSAHHTKPAHVVPSAANLRMLWVQPGTFTMGSPVTEAGREASKEQEHNVTLTEGFYLGKYEVTQAQYEAVMAGNTNGLSTTPSEWPNNLNRPVEKVSWDDIQIFLARLNTLEAANLPAGWTYVLPTESQWEYACRAGTTTAYSWGNDINSTRANYNWDGGTTTGNDFKQTRDVGQYAANSWGLFDMHGNVWEWTADRYQAAYPTGNPVIDPVGPASGTSRVLRGGSWINDGPHLRSAERHGHNTSYRSYYLGFRLAFRQTSPPPPITDANFTTAINLWFSDEANATRIYGHIKDWNVSGVTNMSNAFKDRTTFNEDISGWDMSNVTNMNRMFEGASSFNQPIGDWNVSAVTTIWGIFTNAIAFNQPIGTWEVGKVTNFASMFKGASIFDQPLADWNTSASTNMASMFKDAISFNQDIGSWDVSSVITMHSMFDGADLFNKPIGNWNISSVTTIWGIFRNTNSFNQDLGNWNTSNVTSMSVMFEGANSFNGFIASWDLSSVTNFINMFQNTPALSNTNKGKIHASFSSNSNWPYDWSAHVAAPPPNQTGDNNQTNPPPDDNGTSPPVDNSQTQIDQNATEPAPGVPVVTLYRPLPKTLAREELENGKIRLWGMILANGGSPVTETAFEVADNLVFRNSTLHPASMLEGTPNFYASLTLEPGKRYYYRAVVTNSVGTTKGSPKKFTTAGSPDRWWLESIPQGKDWRTSLWFGTFRPYDNGWIHHAKLGWAYAHPDGSGGLWLWMRDHRWSWTQKGVFPYLWKHQSASWHYLLGTQNGQPVFYEWKESAPNKLR